MGILSFGVLELVRMVNNWRVNRLMIKAELVWWRALLSYLCAVVLAAGLPAAGLSASELSASGRSATRQSDFPHVATQPAGGGNARAASSSGPANKKLTAVETTAGEQPANRPVKDKWALVVGISKFAKSDLNLKYADMDAQDFYNYLINEGQFARDHVKLLLNEQATQRRILSELGSKWLPRVAGPDDLVVLYVSSHGSASESDIEGVNYLVAYDTDPDDLYASGIEMQQLAYMVKRRVHSDRVVLFLDACHSGSAKAAKGIQRKANVDAAKISQGTGQMVIASSKPDQISWEFRDRPNSVFTRCLIDGLHRNGADTTLDEAFGFMKEKVQQIVLRERGEMQSPVLKSAWKGGELIIAAKPVKPQPGLSESEENQYQEPASQPVAGANVSTTPAASAPENIPKPATPYGQNYSQSMSGAVVPINQTPQQNNTVSKLETPPAATKTALSPRVAFLPFLDVDPTHASVEQSANLLWGHMSGVDDYRGLAGLLQTDLRAQAEEFASGRIVPQEAVIDALNTLGIDAARRPGPGDWARLGAALNAKYLVTGSIDEAHFHITMMANQYTLIASMRVMSGETGQTLKAVDHLRVFKAPLTGDMGGGLKYFQKVVCQVLSERLGKELRSAIPAP